MNTKEIIEIIKGIGTIVLVQGKDIVSTVIGLIIMVCTMAISIGDMAVPSNTTWDKGIKSFISTLNTISDALILKSK